VLSHERVRLKKTTFLRKLYGAKAMLSLLIAEHCSAAQTYATIQKRFLKTVSIIQKEGMPKLPLHCWKYGRKRNYCGPKSAVANMNVFCLCPVIVL